MNKEVNITVMPKILFFWYVTVFISTELLSLFNLINRPLIISINLIFLAANLFLFRKEITNLTSKVFIKRSFFFYITIMVLVLTFIQGFLSAPNTTDSMVRRLPIVMYWVQEHTLYQDVIRNGHDFMGPFPEYIFLHLYLIFGGDKMLFFSQWIAFVTVIILSFIVAKRLGVSSRVASYVALFTSTLPIAVLQSTSVQTDMVTTALVFLSIYFALNFIEKPNFTNCLILSFAMGLGILSKATFFLYIIFPLGICLPFVVKQWKKALLFGIISIFLIGIIQLRFSEQNLRLYGGIMGQKVLEGGSGYTNEVISPQITLSNLIKNLAVQLPFPIGRETVNNFIIFLHQQMGINIDDPKTNFYDTRFSLNPIIFPQEDKAGNPIHLVITVLAGWLLIFKSSKFKRDKLAVYLYLLNLVFLLLFSIVLKWQPFHTRLLMPFFIIGSITSLIIVFRIGKLVNYINIFLATSIILSFIIIILNVSRPFISFNPFYSFVKSLAPPLSSSPESFFIKDREKQYFNARYYWYKPYKEIAKKVKEQGLQETVSFKLMDEFEYPLWFFLRKNDSLIRIVPYSKVSDKTIIISTTEKENNLPGYKTECIKTEIEYGYACISIKNDNILVK